MRQECCNIDESNKISMSNSDALRLDERWFDDLLLYGLRKVAADNNRCVGQDHTGGAV